MRNRGTVNDSEQFGELLAQARNTDKDVSLRLNDYILLISRLKSNLSVPNLVILCSIVGDICELNHSIGTYNSEILDKLEEDLIKLISIYKSSSFQYTVSKEISATLDLYENEIQNFQKCVTRITGSISYKFPLILVILTAICLTFAIYRYIIDRFE